MSEDDFSSLAARSPASAPGPDGISYLFWAHAGPAALSLLYLAYRAIASGVSPPMGFSEASLVFIPKALGLHLHRGGVLRPPTRHSAIDAF